MAKIPALNSKKGEDAKNHESGRNEDNKGRKTHENKKLLKRIKEENHHERNKSLDINRFLY